MQFSAPIYVLKRDAKRLARDTSIPLHQALDTVAQRQGFRSWSHLAASKTLASPADEVLAQLKSGTLSLIGARPGQGKTLLGLELAANAERIGRKGFFFTLDYHERQVAEQFAGLGIEIRNAERTLVVDTSDDISADHIIARLKAAAEPALILVDYLQLLDQKRSNPSLDDQMRRLHAFSHQTGAICAVISQIDRQFDLQGGSMPGIADIRLPNPLDLSVFSRFIFLHGGQIRLTAA